MKMPSRKRTPKAIEPKANKLAQEARRTVITYLVADGIYRPKAILAELARRDMKVGRTQLWNDMRALDAEEERDFRDHRKRFRHVVFNRYLRRERDAEKSIADIRADEDENYRRLSDYRELRKASEKVGGPLPEKPKLHEIDYHAKVALLRVSMEALDKASAIAGIATTVVGMEDGDLAAWAQLAREGGHDAFAKRRARVFPEYERARKQRSGRGGAGS